MTTEVPSSEIARTMEVLAREFGLRILPKRPFVIPQVSPTQIERLVTSKGRELVEIHLEGMQQFLEMPAMVDKFQTHPERRRRMSQAIPGLDPKVYVPILDNNQLRGGVWQSTAGAFYIIRDRVRGQEFPDYVTRLDEMHKEVSLRLYGNNEKDEKVAPSYDEKPTDEKVADVQFLEDRTLEVLAWFAEPTPTTTEKFYLS